MGPKNIGLAIENIINQAAQEIQKHYRSLEQNARQSEFAIDKIELTIGFDLQHGADGTPRLLLAEKQHSLKFLFSKKLPAQVGDSTPTEPVIASGAPMPKNTARLLAPIPEKKRSTAIAKPPEKIIPLPAHEIALFDDDEPAATIDLDESELLTGSGDEIYTKGKIIIKDEELGEPKGHVLLEKIGQGGMSSVYLAQNVETSELCVIKFLSIVSKDTDTLKRFFQEVRISLRLEHPHIARIFGFDKTAKNVWYLIFEYIKGKDLKSLIKESGSITAKSALKIAFEVASALKHAFQFHIIHRDLKPENILLENSSGKYQTN